MSKHCKNWYYKYDTLQDCLDNEKNFEKIPTTNLATTDPATTDLATMDLATTKASTTSRPTTGSSAMMSVTVTLETNEDYAETFGEDFDSEVKTTEEIDHIFEATSASPLVPENVETLLKAEVKAKVGVDGKLLTAVFSVELAGGAIMTYLLYKGMKAIGGYLWNAPNQADNEKSNLPLHENEATNPEETIRPENRDDDSDGSYRTANLDSTRVNETRVTNLSSFSPIGEPQWNRTQSNLDLPSTSRPSKISKSPSAPILLDLNQSGLDESLEGQDASDLLGMSVLQPAAQIIETAAKSNTATKKTVTFDISTTAPASTTATAASTTAASTSAASTATVIVNPFHVNNGASTNEVSDADQPPRRYPTRKRSPPKRFGWE